MAHERSGGIWLRLLAALPPALLAVLVVIFDVARDAPESYDCNGSPGPNHDAAVAAFSDGSVTWHAIAILLCLAAVVALSASRSERRGLQAIGLPTFSAAGVVGLLTLLGLASLDGIGLLVGLVVLLIGAPGLLLAHPDAGPLAVFAALLLASSAVLVWIEVENGHLRWAAAGLWWLIAFAGGHLALIQIAGHGPIAC